MGDPMVDQNHITGFDFEYFVVQRELTFPAENEKELPVLGDLGGLVPRRGSPFRMFADDPPDPPVETVRRPRRP